MKITTALICCSIVFVLTKMYLDKREITDKFNKYEIQSNELSLKHNNIVDLLEKTSSQLLKLSEIIINHDHKNMKEKVVHEKVVHETVDHEHGIIDNVVVSYELDCLFKAFDEPKSRRDR